MDLAKIQQVLPHFRYEWRQLNLMAQRIVQYNHCRGELESGIWSAVVESFATHARVLIDVLYRGAKYKSDVAATDFLIDRTSWPRFQGTPEETEILDIVDRVNQQIVHLTYRRAGYSLTEFSWDITRIVELLEKRMRLLHNLTKREGRVGLLGPDEMAYLRMGPGSDTRESPTQTGEARVQIHARTDI